MISITIPFSFFQSTPYSRLAVEMFAVGVRVGPYGGRRRPDDTEVRKAFTALMEHGQYCFHRNSFVTDPAVSTHAASCDY
jgi:hypothetical protein